MPRLRFILSRGHYLLHMRQMPAAYRKESTVRTRLDTTPCQFQATICGADHVAREMLSPQAQKWWLQNHSGKMARWWHILQVFVGYWLGWGSDISIWCNRIERSFLRGYVERKKSERKILENCFECGRYSRTYESAQWLYRSEAQMQKTVWRSGAGMAKLGPSSWNSGTWATGWG